MRSIQNIQLPVPGIVDLAADARAEKYAFIDRLLLEWAGNQNRFEAEGEALCGVLDEGIVVAIGGLNCDPFLRLADVGRMRRIYVRPAWRRQGIGEGLVLHLLGEARKTFRSVRLRTENEAAARLYERLGFDPIHDPHATHILTFDSDRSAK